LGVVPVRVRVSSRQSYVNVPRKSINPAEAQVTPSDALTAMGSLKQGLPNVEQGGQINGDGRRRRKSSVDG